MSVTVSFIDGTAVPSTLHPAQVSFFFPKGLAGLRALRGINSSGNSSTTGGITSSSHSSAAGDAIQFVFPDERGVVRLEPNCYYTTQPPETTSTPASSGPSATQQQQYQLQQQQQQQQVRGYVSQPEYLYSNNSDSNPLMPRFSDITPHTSQPSNPAYGPGSGVGGPLAADQSSSNNAQMDSPAIAAFMCAAEAPGSFQGVYGGAAPPLPQPQPQGIPLAYSAYPHELSALPGDAAPHLAIVDPEEADDGSCLSARAAEQAADCATAPPHVQPPETREGKLIQDRVHEHILLPMLAFRIIDTPEFQRLRYLMQLGTTVLLYPGATHTRFEHSIGVAHLASQTVKYYATRQPELRITEADILCVTIAGLCHDIGHGPFSHLFEQIVNRIREDEREAALQADLGANGVHNNNNNTSRAREGPLLGAATAAATHANAYSHDTRGKRSRSRGPTASASAAEPRANPSGTARWRGARAGAGWRANREPWHHEDMSVRLIRRILSRINLDEYGLNGADARFIELCIRGLRPSEPWPHDVGRPPHKRFLVDIVANKRNDVDVDKLDYFMRDSLGVYGKEAGDVQFARLLGASRVLCFEQQYQICYEEKVALSLGDVFAVRAKLHKYVYQHRIVKVTDHMVIDALAAADPFFLLFDSEGRAYRISECVNSAEVFMQLGDWLLNAIAASPDRNLAKARGIISRLTQRRLYTIVTTASFGYMKTGLTTERIRDDIIALVVAEFCDEAGEIMRSAAQRRVESCEDDALEQQQPHASTTVINTGVPVPYDDESVKSADRAARHRHSGRASAEEQEGGTGSMGGDATSGGAPHHERGEDDEDDKLSTTPTDMADTGSNSNMSMDVKQIEAALQESLIVSFSRITYGSSDANGIPDDPINNVVFYNPKNIATGPHKLPKDRVSPLFSPSEFCETTLMVMLRDDTLYTVVAKATERWKERNHKYLSVAVPTANRSSPKRAANAVAGSGGATGAASLTPHSLKRQRPPQQQSAASSTTVGSGVPRPHSHARTEAYASGGGGGEWMPETAMATAVSAPYKNRSDAHAYTYVPSPASTRPPEEARQAPYRSPHPYHQEPSLSTHRPAPSYAAVVHHNGGDTAPQPILRPVVMNRQTQHATKPSFARSAQPPQHTHHYQPQEPHLQHYSQRPPQ